MAIPASPTATSAPPQENMRVAVLMPASVDAAFDYFVPLGTPEGALVEATLAGRKLVGAVWRAAPEANDVPDHKIKPITQVLQGPALAECFREWLDWMAEFTLAPKGAVLSLCGLAYAAKTPKKALAVPAFKIELPRLTDAQQKAADALLCDTKPTLLDGVTGSGKTEVYFHGIAAALAAQKQVLVLLPEIALTHQWLARFEKTFGAAPVVWHSRMTPAAKARAWQAVANGAAPVVVGARSALFLPFKQLGLIIVDEEHDPSYKQDDGVLYHARDMAIVRAHFEKIPITLVSATPSLETLENITQGKYRTLHLPERFGAAGLPTVKLVDMRIDVPERGDFLSPLVKGEMLNTLARGEQSLLFLNRRGYAPLLLCRACGHRFECNNCSAWLVVHGTSRLECHHCGHKEKIPEACPKCEADKDKLAPCGPGVERIAEEVRAMFCSSHHRGEDGRVAQERKGHPTEKTLSHARELRKEMTDAEKKLWKMLRAKSLDVPFRKQHPLGHYIADFASYSPKLIIELDGGQHTTLEASAYDKERTEFFESQGFRVLRFWNDEVLKNCDGVMARIQEALVGAASPHHNPPPAGEGISSPRIVVLSSDEAIAAETWDAIEKGEIDILVGTQMVAKGHHFPRLTFVAVVDADVGLSGADLRAGERTYQLLHQLGGRAGRGDKPGTVLVQTYEPNHPVMKALAAQDRDTLMALEAKERKAGAWPPYGQLAAILLDGVNEANVKRAGQIMAQSAPNDPRIRVLGPAPAPMSKLRGQYRYRLLVKAQKGINLQGTLRNWLHGTKFPGVRIKIDVNPYYFL